MFRNFNRMITRDLRRHRELRVLKISSSDVNTGYCLTREGGLMSEVERTRALTQPRRTICCDQSRSLRSLVTLTRAKRYTYTLNPLYCRYRCARTPIYCVTSRDSAESAYLYVHIK